MASSHSSLYVYLPTRQGLNVAAGTAFVSAQSPGVGEQLPLDYEPPRRGGAAGERFADRVDIAARRHVEQTRSFGRSTLPVARLILVAIYDPDRGTVAPFGPVAEALLARWCEVDSICEVPLTRSLPATAASEDGGASPSVDTHSLSDWAGTKASLGGRGELQRLQAA
jgi:hypothetical protein